MNSSIALESHDSPKYRSLVTALVCLLAVGQVASFVYFVSHSRHFVYDLRARELKKFSLPENPIGTEYWMKQGEKGRSLLLSGWSQTDSASCTWSKAKQMELFVPIKSSDTHSYRVQLIMQPYLEGKAVLPIQVSSGSVKQSFELSINPSTWKIEFESPPADEQAAYRKISINVPDPVSPFQLRKGRDARKLGVCIEGLRVLS